MEKEKKRQTISKLKGNPLKEKSAQFLEWSFMYCNKRIPFLISGFQADTSIYRITKNDQNLIIVTSVTPSLYPLGFGWKKQKAGAFLISTLICTKIIQNTCCSFVEIDIAFRPRLVRVLELHAQSFSRNSIAIIDQYFRISSSIVAIIELQ